MFLCCHFPLLFHENSQTLYTSLSLIKIFLAFIGESTLNAFEGNKEKELLPRKEEERQGTTYKIKRWNAIQQHKSNTKHQKWMLIYTTLWRGLTYRVLSESWRILFIWNSRTSMAFPGGSMVKNLPANAGDTGLTPGLGRSPEGGHGNPLQYSCLENPMDRGGRQSIVHRVTRSQTWLKRLSTCACLSG